MATVGERRLIKGQLAEWDGKGWLPVEESQTAEGLVRKFNMMPVPGEEEVLGMWQNLPREMARGVVEELPAIGGTAGLALGNPATALALGAGGEALRQLGRRALGDEAPATPEDAALQIAGQGLQEGAYASIAPVGRFAGRAVKGGARAVGETLGKPGVMRAVKAGIDEFGRELPIIGGVVKGYQRAQRVLSKVEKAKLGHQLKRAAKEAQAEAKVASKPVAVQAVKSEAAAVAPEAAAVMPNVDEIQGSIQQMAELGISRPDIAKSLHAKYGSKLEGSTAGRWRTMVDSVLGKEAKAAKAAAPRPSAQPAHPVMSIEEANAERIAKRTAFVNASTDEQMQMIQESVDLGRKYKMSPGQIATDLSRETGLTEYRARQVVDMLLPKAK